MARDSWGPSATFVAGRCLTERNRFPRARPTRPWTCSGIRDGDPIGIEALPRDEAEQLIEAHLSGVSALPEVFAAWGPVALDAPDPHQVDDLLDRGCLGVSLPAGALAAPAALYAIGPLLERIAA